MTGRVHIVFAIAMLLTPSLAAAADADDTWDGMWTSSFAKTWSAARVYFAGNRLIGFYLNGDYLADMQGSVSDSDGVITITWTRGQAILTRDGPASAHLLVMQKGKPDVRLALIGQP